MPTFLWGLQGDLVTLAAADFSELENAASSEEFDQTLRVGLSLAHLKAADPVLYENAIAEGELLGFCPGRVASEILAQRLLFACAESGEESCGLVFLFFFVPTFFFSFFSLLFILFFLTPF